MGFCAYRAPLWQSNGAQIWTSGFGFTIGLSQRMAKARNITRGLASPHPTRIPSRVGRIHFLVSVSQHLLLI